MVNKEKLSEWMGTLSDSIQEQQWYQQIRSKWDELDPQSRTYLQFALVSLSILIALMIVFSSIWRVYSLKRELAQKRTLLSMIQSSSDEIRKLKESIPPGATSGDTDSSSWYKSVESVAMGLGIQKENLQVRSEKPGVSTDSAKETLVELDVNHINVKQLTRFLVALENGQKPIKIRNILLDTKEDPSGYIDSQISISVFAPTRP